MTVRDRESACGSDSNTVPTTMAAKNASGTIRAGGGFLPAPDAPFHTPAPTDLGSAPRDRTSQAATPITQACNAGQVPDPRVRRTRPVSPAHRVGEMAGIAEDTTVDAGFRGSGLLHPPSMCACAASDDIGADLPEFRSAGGAGERLCRCRPAS